MGRLTHYVFRSVWTVEAALADLYVVLADVRTYSAWWPEIRTVKELTHGRFEMVARSLLPYELRFVSEERIETRRAGVIEARLSGDLEGFARWSMETTGTGCRLVYDQEVDTRRALLNALAPVARPGFRMNHSLMMRHGQAGLRTYMAGYAYGSSAKEVAGGGAA
ncbi:MAG: SRPBCC family protein [Acidimicrobiales bacterium]